MPHGVRHTAAELLAWALTPPGTATARGAAWRAEWQALAATIAGQDGLAAAASQVLAGHPDGTRLLITVDQFEELVSAAPDVAHELDAMLGSVTSRWPDGTRRVQAVVVTRIDFLHQLAAFPHINEAWQSTNVVVPPMTREQLRQVISAPLDDLKGIRFAAGVADQILHDTPTGPGALPMLEYTLTELWKRQQRGVITAAAYRDVGGVDGALARSAERALWERADASEHAAVEQVLIQLVRPGEQLDAGGRAPDTRRVASRDEFDDAGWHLIHRLASSRIVVITRQPAGPDTAELAHEALLSAWPRLATWVDDNRDFRSWQEGLRRDMRQWRTHDQDGRFLLDEPDIAEADGWARQRQAELTTAERDYITASVAAAAHRRRRRRYRFGAAALAVIAVVIVGVIAIQQYNNGNAQHRNSLSEQIASEAAGLDATQPNLARQLRMAAYQIAPTPQAYSSLFSGPDLPGTIRVPGVTNAALSPDGHLLALLAVQRVRLWDTATHSDLADVPAAGGPTSAAFGASSKVMAVGQVNGRIELWSLARPQHPAALTTITGSAGPVEQVTFSRGGRLMAAAGWDHDVRLWDMSDPARPSLLAVIPAGTEVAASVAFTRDGRLLATADWDNSVRLWDITTPQQPLPLAVINNRQVARSVVFNLAGSILAVGGDSTVSADNIHLWGVANPRRPVRLAALVAGTSNVAAMAFSPTAPILAATGSVTPGAVSLWNIASPARPAALPPRKSGTDCVLFSPDGQTLVTLSQVNFSSRAPDNDAELWNIADPRNPAAVATVPVPEGEFDSLAVSPDARLLAEAGTTLSGGGLPTQLWDLSNTQLPVRLPGVPVPGTTSALAVHGHRLLLAVGGDGAVTVWDVTSSIRPFRLASFVIGRPGDTEPTINVAFSPGGTVLAALGVDDGIIRLWSLSDLGHIVPLRALSGAPLGGGQISVGPGGHTVTDTMDNQDVGFPSRTEVWDERGTHPSQPAKVLGQSIGEPTVTALDPVAPILATGDGNGVVRLWSTSQPGRPALLATMTGTTAPQNALAFSPDGRILGAGDANNAVHLWSVSDPRDPAVIGTFNAAAAAQQSALVGVSLPVAGSGGRLAVTLENDSAVNIWDVSASSLMGRLCASTGDAITTSQWNQYMPGQPYRPPCQHSG